MVKKESYEERKERYEKQMEKVLPTIDFLVKTAAVHAAVIVKDLRENYNVHVEPVYIFQAVLELLKEMVKD